MKLTSAEAGKLLRKLNDERDALLDKESMSRVFVAATVENLEDARPAYSYAETREQVAALEEQILGMTIDQALVYIPQLTRRKRVLSSMRAIPEKQRNTNTRATNLIEYTYANFDVARSEADYLSVTDELARVQNALDLTNSTVHFEVAL